MEDQDTTVSGGSLLGLGILEVLLLLISSVVSVLTVGMGGITTVLSIVAMIDDPNQMISVAMGSWGLIVRLVQCCGGIALVPAAGWVAYVGLNSMQNAQSSQVMMAAGAGVLVAVINVILNLASCLNFSFCGAAWALPAAIVAVVSIIVAAVAVTTLPDEA